MKTCLILFCVFSSFMMKPADNDPLAALEGTWYVNMSNFKMWLKGTKHNPAFTYTLAEKKGKKGLTDVVSFTKKGKSKQIIGFDKPENEQATKFTWRGKGLLALFKSKWEILYSTNNWTLIHFEKTLATAEGYDVISRSKHLSSETMVAIKAKLKELGVPELTLISQQ
jgi:hypothetical protein